MNFRRILAATTLACLASTALAHGDEDHSQEAAKAAPASAAKAGATASVRHSTSPQRLPDGSLFVPKPLQRQIGVRSQQVVIGPLAATIEFNGKVIADPKPAGASRRPSVRPHRSRPKGHADAGPKVAKGEIAGVSAPRQPAASNAWQPESATSRVGGRSWPLPTRKRTTLDELEGAWRTSGNRSGALRGASALKKRRAAVGASIDRAEAFARTGHGVIGASQRGRRPGGRCQGILFEMIDPARLAVEALAYEAGAGEG
jgi:cobalt-zinc-cadmium efflux system membrane fusion protein